MNVRKLFSKDLHDIDWEVEYNLGRSEAMGTIVSSVMVMAILMQSSPSKQALLRVSTEEDIRNSIFTDKKSMIQA